MSNIQLNNIHNFSDLITKVGITIPLIQRDYVQGRVHNENEFDDVIKTAKIQAILKKYADEREKRDNFVRKMIEALGNNAEEMHLTFIYGKQQKGASGGNCHPDSFVPLDGQQRLTSLALLSWALRRRLPEVSMTNLKNHPNFDAFFKGLASFKYETRPSANEFCSQLFTNYLSPVADILLSKQIQDQPWFNDSWTKDPSVRNMLLMLDFMDEQLIDQTNIPDMLTNMLDGKGIEFELLDMENLKLTDGLYIQMNGRGKQLTAFENWKSSFFRLIEENFSTDKYDGPLDQNSLIFFNNTTITLKDYFSYSIEQQWTNMLWKYCKPTIMQNEGKKNTADYDENCYPVIDDHFMKIFTMLHEIFYYVKSSSANKDFNDTISVREDTFSTIDNVKSLFAYLDIINGIIEKKDFFEELFFTANDNSVLNPDCKVRLFDGKSINLIDRCVYDDNFNNVSKFLLYAILKYIRRVNNYNVTPEMKSFVRQVRNFLEHEAFLKTADASMTNTLKTDQAKKVDNKIEELLDQLSKGDILNITQNHAEIEDFDFCCGNPKPKFLPEKNGAIPPFPLKTVDDILRDFCGLTEYEQVCLLVAYDYKGHKINDNCSHGPTYLFGGKDRWKTIFMDDHNTNTDIESVLKAIIPDYSAKKQSGVTGVNALKDMIAHKKTELTSYNFKYYSLNYENFILALVKGTQPTLYFSSNGDLDKLDLFAVQRTSQPIRAYHTDPIIFATKEELKKRNSISNPTTLYMSYSAQCSDEVRLNIYDKPNGPDQPVAYFKHLVGIHQNGGWEYFEKDSSSQEYKSKEVKNDFDKDRIQAGVEFVVGKFPNRNFNERN